MDNPLSDALPHLHMQQMLKALQSHLLSTIPSPLADVLYECSKGNPRIMTEVCHLEMGVSAG